MRAGNLEKIRALENKYGLVLFRMALTHVVDVGVRHFDADNMAEAIAQIEQKEKESQASGTIQVMTPEFQCAIVRCAGELATFPIWDLFAYVKRHVHIGGDGT
jgi:hypothetical protein